MADNIVGGLFGVDPQQLMQQRQAIDASNAFKFAQLDPMQRAQMAIYQGGAGLGRAASGLLGGDPEMQKVSKIKQLSSQFDLTSATGMREFARSLQSQFPQEAMMAAKRADEIETSGLGRQKTIAETTLAEARTEAALKEKIPKVEEIVNQQLWQQSLQQAGGDPQKAAQIYREQEIKGKERTSPKTTVDLSGLANLFAKEEAKASAKDVTEQISKAQDQLKTNSKLSRDIAELEKIIPNTFTGQLSDIAKTSSKTLSAIGVPVSEKASNTEVANALFNNFVLPAVKQLPGSLAAKELAFLQQTKPNSLQEPATINRLVKMIKEDISVNRALVKRADAYQKQDKLGSLQGFNIALQSDEIYTNMNKYNALKARVQAKQPITKDEAEFAKSVEKELGL
jgi:hypothetical protein